LSLDGSYFSEALAVLKRSKPTRLSRPLRPPESFPPVVPPLNFDCTKSFIMVIAAPLTASCLFPEAEPPVLSKSLVASAIARLINWVWELPPPWLELEELEPEVNCLRT
jgi:hypothetical protein